MQFTQEHDEIRRTLRAIIDRDINPNVDQWEEDGIFPVTLVEFSGPEWDAAMEAWERAHPGQQLIED